MPRFSVSAAALVTWDVDSAQLMDRVLTLTPRSSPVPMSDPEDTYTSARNQLATQRDGVISLSCWRPRGSYSNLLVLNTTGSL